MYIDMFLKWHIFIYITVNANDANFKIVITICTRTPLNAIVLF